MIRIFRRFFHVNWAEQWQYRANMLMYLLYWLVSPVVYLSVWSAVARSQGGVKGLSANDFVTYYLTLLAVDVLTSEITIHILAYRIQDGTLSGDLLRPVHPILTGTLANNLAFKALTFAALIPIWGVLYLLLRPDYSGMSAQSLLLGLPMIVLGFAISFLLGATLTCVAFWTTRVYAVSEFFYALAVLFSGQFVSLELMPPAIRTAAAVLPFQFMRYLPVQIILGKVPPDQVAAHFAAGLLWLVVLGLLFATVWRAGIRRFAAVGA